VVEANLDGDREEDDDRVNSRLRVQPSSLKNVLDRVASLGFQKRGLSLLYMTRLTVPA
jgi:hypothetical protein